MKHDCNLSIIKYKSHFSLIAVVYMSKTGDPIERGEYTTTRTKNFTVKTFNGITMKETLAITTCTIDILISNIVDDC